MHGKSPVYDEDIELKRSLYTGMEDSYFPYISSEQTIVDDNDNIIQSITQDGQFPDLSESTVMSKQSSSLDDSTAQELTEADVYTQLEKKERDLVLAAELGKALLEQNEELRSESDRLEDQYRHKIETLEQERYALQQQLKIKQSEVDAISQEAGADVAQLQNELEQQLVQAKSKERENTKIIEELTDQNQKLLDQLNRASKAEEQLTSQVQQLRTDFNERAMKSTSRISQLETLKEEIQQGANCNNILEQRYRAMCDDRDHAISALSDANERMKILERQLHEKDRDLKHATVELSDSHNTNRQLQIRIDELREEMSLQMSFNSGTESLLSEIEHSGLSQDDLMELSKSVSSLSSKNPNTSDEKDTGDDMVNDDIMMGLSDEQCVVPGKLFTYLANSVNNCLTQIFELKQEIWDAYLKVKNLSDALRPVVEVAIEAENEIEHKHKEVTTGGLIHVIMDLGELITVVINRANSTSTKKSEPEIESSVETFDKIIKERDEACKSKKILEVELARTKADLLTVNSQLIEAIQQKVDQQQELEAWHDDMELMIQKALVERNEATRALSSALKKNAQLGENFKQTTPTKSPWQSMFSFGRTRKASGGDNASNASSEESGVPSPSPKLKRQSPSSTSPSIQRTPSRLTSWMRRKQQPEMNVEETEPT